ALEAAARGVLPLGLGGEPNARPGAVGQGVVVRDVHHRMVPAAVETGGGALGAAPVGTVDLTPPRGGGRRTGRREVVGEETAEDERPAVAFGVRAMAGGLGRAHV